MFQERIVDALKQCGSNSAHATDLYVNTLLFVRVLLLRMPFESLSALWAVIVSEMIRVFALSTSNIIIAANSSSSSSGSSNNSSNSGAGGDGEAANTNRMVFAACKVSASHSVHLYIAPLLTMPHTALWVCSLSILPEPCCPSTTTTSSGCLLR